MRFKTIMMVCCLAVLATSCSDDETTPTNVQTSKYQNLTQRDHVLENLERAYNDRNINEYDKVLDDNFLFFFSLDDVNDPDNPAPSQWDRLTDTASARNMFNPNWDGGNGRDPIVSITLTLQYLPDSWTPVIPEDQVRYPGETWYGKQVGYTLFVQTAGETDYLSEDITAQFTVRSAEVGGRVIWRIVSWRDDIPGAATRRAASESTTWGGIKALYKGGIPQ